MLLCDGCDLGYHLECLNPPMNEVPMDEWYCPDCSRNSQDDAEVVRAHRPLDSLACRKFRLVKTFSLKMICRLTSISTKYRI